MQEKCAFHKTTILKKLSFFAQFFQSTLVKKCEHSSVITATRARVRRITIPTIAILMMLEYFIMFNWLNTHAARPRQPGSHSLCAGWYCCCVCCCCRSCHSDSSRQHSPEERGSNHELRSWLFSRRWFYTCCGHRHYDGIAVVRSMSRT
jgi:hypothetical protein